MLRSIRRPAAARRVLLLCLLALLLLPTGRAPLARVPAAGAQAPADRPNVVVVLLDDADIGVIGAMPNVRTQLARQGSSFSRFVVSTPLCCPSRATLLRGQYTHNHGVRRNNGEAGGFETFFGLDREDSTLATWLQGAGYRTGLFGKYLNRYPNDAPRAYVPPAGTTGAPSSRPAATSTLTTR